MAPMENLSFTRRQFLQSTAAAGSAVALAGVAPASLLSAPVPGPGSEPIPAWASKPMRWFQLTLVEDDPLHYSPDFWLDYFKRTRSEGVCLSGGGCVAYYPTEIPFHHRSRWLNNRDVLGELITGSRKHGMSILVRTDPHATWDDTRQAHPDWIAVDVDGNPRRHWVMHEMWLTCAYGPYNFEFMTAVHKEIMNRYHVDGLFHNRWDGEGICYCVHCVTNFRKAAGKDLPRKVDAKDPTYRAWMQWRQNTLMKLLDVWNAAIRPINPESACIPNAGGALSQIDDVEISKRVPLLAADRQGRSGLAVPWFIGKTAKEYRATLGTKPAIGLFNVGIEDRHRWKDSVTSDAEIRIWALDALAHGMRPWCCKFCGTLYDERWLKGVEDLFVWTEKNRDDLVQQQPIARVALVYSQQTAWFYGGQQAHAKVEDYALGWCQALTESRIPFEMVHDRLLDTTHLAPYKSLILPNIAALSDAQCAQLRDFVAGGGSLIGTYETSLYDENGEQRKNFGLSDLFGVDWTGKSEGPMQNSYIRLEHEAL
ncbi:MAG TPA: alpha-amylase family protein, partial [Terracidiphilus sp.]|nr:alpha-amylase family protein [Terracidiphilus sp.]